MTLSDALSLTGIAVGSAVLVGLLGVAALLLARRTPLAVQIAIVAATGILSVIAGIVTASGAMYVSEHDLGVGVFVAAASGVVSIGIAVLLGVTVARGARRLRSAVRAIGDGGEVPPGPAVSSEFAALESELAATGRRLAAARDEVERGEAARRELVTWISHDLRTPLAGLRAMAEALEDGVAGRPEEYLARMRGQVDRITVLVDDLFELSRMQSGALTLDRHPVAVRDLLSDAVADLGPLAATRGIRISSDAPPLTVDGDVRLLGRVVGNLVVNAIQHSPDGAAIELDARADGDRVLLTVTDHAGGIAADDLDRVFEAGWRGSGPRTPAPLPQLTAGAGIGLAIARGVVDAHDGDIAAQNTADGCRFTVTLPAA